VSQGHSDAIRRIDGVLDAKQYTIPVESALEAVRAGDAPQLTTRQKHLRECFVVAAPDADKERIEREIARLEERGFAYYYNAERSTELQPLGENK
jgi:diaminopimelate dehydrogenase